MSALAVIDAERFRLGVAGTIVPAAEWHTAEQAHALLERANQALAEARTDAERQRRDGFEQGRAEGHAAGLSEFAQALAVLVKARDSFMDDLRAQVVELTIAVVDHIAPRIGAQAMLPALAVEAVQQLATEPALLVKVHPTVAEPVRACVEALEGAALPKTDVVADDELGEFDCVIETQGGLVCAGLSEQLQQVGKILAAARRAPEAGEEGAAHAE